MVYTLIFCPSLEYSATLDEISVGADNLISNGDLHAAGCGVIIAKVMNELGVRTTVMGFAAGFTGGEIETILRGRGVNTDIVYLEKGLSPFNVVLDHGEKFTRFSGEPLEISHNELMSLLSRFERLTDGDTLVITGSVPPSVPADVYSFIPDSFAGKNVRIILDVPAEPLAKCLQLDPFLVITDRKRIGEIFGEQPQSADEVIAYISTIQDMGAQNVLYTGDDGTAIFLDSDKNILKQQIPTDITFDETALSSFAAGFLVGSVDKDVDNEYSLMLAASAAHAAAAQKAVPSKSSIMSIMMEKMKKVV